MEPGQVVIDLDKMRLLVADLGVARDEFRLRAREIRRALTDASVYALRANTLDFAADWADEQIGMLQRRLALAEAVDDEAGSGVTPTGVVTMRDTLLGYDTAEQARDGGEAFARSLRGPDGTYTMTPEQARRLTDHYGDPDFVSGFVNTLGPGGLATLVASLKGVDEPVDVVPGVDPAANPGPALNALANSFATYTRFNPVDERWLGKFSTSGRDDLFETGLMTPLLASPGPYEAGFLNLLGARVFDPPVDVYGDAGAVQEVDLNAVSNAAGTFADRGLYDAAVLYAISHNPHLASEFANAHIVEILAASRAETGAVPLTDPAPGQVTPVEQARAALVSAAGSMRAREVDPLAADTFVARLAFEMHAAPAAHVSVPMRVAFADVVTAYGNDMYHSVISLVPETQALRDDGGNVATVWPGDDKLWAGTARSGLTIGLPAELWGSLVQEALLGGADPAARIWAGTKQFAENLENSAFFSNRGYQFMDPVTGGPPTQELNGPMDLATLQAGLVRRFLAEQIDATVTRRAGEIEDAEKDGTRSVDPALNAVGEISKALLNPTSKANLLNRVVDGGVKAVIETIEHTIRVNSDTTDPGAVTSGVRADVDALLAEYSYPPGNWQETYREGARRIPQYTDSDPPVHVQSWVPGEAPVQTVYTGDPFRDGFISTPGAPEDFTELAPNTDRLKPKDPTEMTAPQLESYVRWLSSPGVVANNDFLRTEVSQRMAGGRAPEPASPNGG